MSRLGNRPDIMRDYADGLRSAGLSGRQGIAGGGGKRVDADARRLMDDIPSDTRSLTARLFGDPLPGRRAIDRRP